ncbi:LysR family transcriptional regulator [Legionella sainthelensi]|uniref:LysR family transcriptional regulator n=1 Tax=Legionella sainthelensi TaxID=28087 RepID=UPI000E20A80A|nr:LysR family transcriptional regulator [Legionella sainthelensi]
MKFYISLAVFLAAYRLNSFSLAAKKLHISQAAVSIHIKNLEHYFGKILFRREGRKISATEEAFYLSTLLADSIDNMENVVEKFSTYSNTIEGHITIGCIRDVPRFWIIPRISCCLEKGIKIINSTYLDERAIIDEILNGKIDFGITTTQNNHKTLTCIRLFEDSLALLGTKRWESYIDKTNINTAYKSLRTLNWLAYNKDLLFIQEYIEMVFQGKSNFIDPDFILGDLRGLSFAAAAGCGVTVLPRKLFSYPIYKNALFLIYDPQIAPTLNFYLIYKTKKLNRRMEFLKDAILNDVNLFESKFYIELYGPFPNGWSEQ